MAGSGPASAARSLRNGHFGAQLLLPGVEFFQQLRCPLGIASGQIPTLPEVLREVVEFVAPMMVKLDELPVAVADGGAGSPGRAVVVRVMPVEGGAG